MAETGQRSFADVDAEREAWYEVSALVRSVRLEDRTRPRYYLEPPWSIRDVVGHLGAWLAEAAAQLERINGGTYEGHDVDIDGLNARFLAGMADLAWEDVWSQASSARTRMLLSWQALPEPSSEADWWIRKSGWEHDQEHLPRLRAWVAELAAR